jgi:retron-type reverse transcriptase
LIDADISKYFDAIPHAKLMAVIAERISDSGILHLIKMWLKAAVVEEGEDGKRRYVGGGKANRQGTPMVERVIQAARASLLDEVLFFYLHPFSVSTNSGEV